MKLDGFGLFVIDMDKMVSFYRDILGFDIQYKPGDGNVYLVKDGVLFLMYGRKDFENMVSNKFYYPKGYNGTVEIALSVSTYADVDSTYHTLKNQGVSILMTPQTMPWGQRTFYFADPEGNLIEVGSFQSNESQKRSDYILDS